MVYNLDKPFLQFWTTWLLHIPICLFLGGHHINSSIGNWGGPLFTYFWRLSIVFFYTIKSFCIINKGNHFWMPCFFIMDANDSISGYTVISVYVHIVHLAILGPSTVEMQFLNVWALLYHHVKRILWELVIFKYCLSTE